MVDKIKQIEEEVLKKPQKDLQKAMDPLKLGLDEMKKTFWGIFDIVSTKNKNIITKEMEKFEKNWLKENWRLQD